MYNLVSFNYPKSFNKFKNHLGLNWIGFQGNYSFLYFIKPLSLKSFITSKRYYFIFKNKDYNKISFLSKKFYDSFMGVTLGHSISLRVIGVGFKLESDKNRYLTLKLGFSHDIKVELLPGLKFKRLNDRSSIYIFTFDNVQILNNFLTKIKNYRPVEPYKGKGLRYLNEFLIRKEGKKSNL